ncbi:N-succinylarginine dihydrolase [Sneathiella sp.]|jgi:succinylarginine dihydrolase|uniref:N-succinylarginine dihydrolase n=1 Tax=Sneathiella sp. TaxID=1964365 RepID=UPI0039E2DEC8
MTLSAEINFDGLVGPTHNFAGLSHGNVASTKNRDASSHPKAAALQGLQKMKSLMDVGLMQGVLPPLERPHIPTLRALGFTGTDEHILSTVQKQAPHLLASVSSASSMWVANAATVSPAADTTDGRTHFTPANLSEMFHRSIEHPDTGRILKKIFSHPDYFAHHDALPPGSFFSDEGAANHTRLTPSAESPGVEIFTYGRSAFDLSTPRPARYPARQTREACEAVARNHGLSANRTLFVQQNPAVIDAGVFHNDVIAVGSANCLFFHQDAFLNSEEFIQKLKRCFTGNPLSLIEVSRKDVPVEDAVATYLFNTQLVQLPGTENDLQLIAPMECKNNSRVYDYLNHLLAQNTPIKTIHYKELRESMNNGGGPACLRLRVSLSEAERDSLQTRVLLDNALYEDLVAWVHKHYRDTLSPADLADPQLLQESREALDHLTDILKLGSVYPFQLS